LAARLIDDAHDVGLLHDQEFFAVDLDLGDHLPNSTSLTPPTAPTLCLSLVHGLQT
jgi:hypothetical protein